MRRRLASMLVLGCFLSLAVPAQEQRPLTGVVTDEDGRPVAGAEVLLTPAEAAGADIELRATSGDDGRWTLCCAAVGTWRIRVRLDGYYEADGLVAVPGDRSPAPVDVSLRPLTEELPASTEGNPDTIRSWIDKGETLLRQERWTEARSELEKAVAALPPTEHPVLLQTIARTHFMEGDLDAAEQVLERALRLAPKDETLRSVYLGLLENRDRRGDAEEFLHALPDEPELPVPAPDEGRTPSLPPAIAALLDSEPLPPEPGRTGTFVTTFEDRSPLSSLEEYLERSGLTRENVLSVDPDGLEYELAEESFTVVVPESWSPDEEWGLVVYVSPRAFGGVFSEETKRVLAEHRLVWAGANRAGNARAKWDRWGLALDAAHGMRKLYDLDPERIYVAGYSGGGRVASALATLYPEAFSGALCLYGVDYWSPVSVPDRPGHSWPAAFAKPRRKDLKRVKESTRFVILTGDRDFNRQQSRAISDRMRADGYEEVHFLEVPEADHYTAPTPEWWDRALDALDPAP